MISKVKAAHSGAKIRQREGIHPPARLCVADIQRAEHMCRSEQRDVDLDMENLLLLLLLPWSSGKIISSDWLTHQYHHGTQIIEGKEKLHFVSQKQFFICLHSCLHFMFYDLTNCPGAILSELLLD